MMSGWSDAAFWFAGAILSVIAEIVAPGFFLIFLGAGAAVAGIAALVAPELPLVAQALLCAVATALAAGSGWRWYRATRLGVAAEPLLNDRAARLIGARLIVCEPIIGGGGRVAVADGSWPARGPDAVAGAPVRVVAVRDGALMVEPLAR